ncbi:predicted protein [Naegleria gruberi]|uniref:Predicted protein n=1 Tax=Naegleria gruberi TaxID=5762 RepID=D2V9H6_NAEGR|nr:uncharacterized protein NAEGRDRAFT_65445 [Naegleria gruberi]EFC46460.1 predicted protein [Naegleria gruberi]|eukprot:XP_002679204.1 predicted protein [Naegleria gruberi strain NEG-M]
MPTNISTQQNTKLHQGNPKKHHQFRISTQQNTNQNETTINDPTPSQVLESETKPEQPQEVDLQLRAVENQLEASKYMNDIISENVYYTIINTGYGKDWALDSNNGLTGLDSLKLGYVDNKDATNKIWEFVLVEDSKHPNSRKFKIRSIYDTIIDSVGSFGSETSLSKDDLRSKSDWLWSIESVKGGYQIKSYDNKLLCGYSRGCSVGLEGLNDSLEYTTWKICKSNYEPYSSKPIDGVYVKQSDNSYCAQDILQTGVCYKIRSIYNTILVEKGGLICLEEDNSEDNNMWEFVPCALKGKYRIRFVGENKALEVGERNCVKSCQDDSEHKAARLWEIISTKVEDKYAIRSCKESHWLAVEHLTLTLSNEPIKYGNLWAFVPIGYSLKMKVFEFKFYEDDKFKTPISNEFLAKKTANEFLSIDVVSVKSSDIGSTFSRSYTKRVSESYTWNISCSFGYKVSAELNAEIVKSTVEKSIDLEVGTSWTNTTEKEYSNTVSVCPSKEGDYRISMSVQMVNNIKKYFKAKAKVVAVRNDERLRYPLLRKMLEKSSNCKILDEKGDDYLMVEITGDVEASYGVGSHSVIEKIEENQKTVQTQNQTPENIGSF